jgi:hypothetical protein
VLLINEENSKVFLKYLKSVFKKKKKKKKIPDISTIESFFNIENAKGLLAFGDSVSVRFSKDDADTRSLIDLLTDHCKSQNINVFDCSYSAFHPGVYEAISQMVCRLEYRPSVVVIPINLRCFSPQWDLNPKWQHNEIIDSAYNLSKVNISKKILGKTGTPDTMEEYDNLPVIYPFVSSLNKIGDFRQWVERKNIVGDEVNERYKNIFIFHYLHKLRLDNRRLKSLVNAIQILINNDIKVVSYICPVNFVSGGKFVGDDFELLLSNNISTVRNALKENFLDSDVFCHDFSKSFTPEFFFQPNSPVEHVNFSGRDVMAKYIGSCVAEQFKNN